LGWLTVSARELRRIEVLTEVLAGRRTTASAAIVLDMSVRQAQRLLTRYRDGGGALIHKARGRASNYQLSTGIRDYTLELIRQSYRDFDPTLAAEVLLERHGLQVSRETLRKWIVEAGLWLSRISRGCDVSVTAN
jgi:transposase